MIHTFPSQLSAAESFPDARAVGRDVQELQPAYAGLIDELVAQGMTPEQARCGVIDEIAGRSVAASFVGTAAACIVIAEILRDLRGARRYALIDVSLRELSARQVVEVDVPIEPASYGSIISATD